MEIVRQEPTNAKGETIRDRLASPEMLRQMASVLPKHLTAERMARIAIAAMTRTPKLAQCTPASVYASMMMLSQFGLEPDGRHAHLIPFENRKKGTVECQCIIDYKGLVELAYRSSRISNIHADRICSNDEFEQVNGTVTHRRAKLGTPRGEAIGFYCIVTFKDGTTKSEVMDIEEIEAVRSRSKSPDDGPWNTDPSEMAKKTVFKRLSKWIPLSPEFRDAVAADDAAEAAPALPSTSAASALLAPVSNLDGASENAAPTEAPAPRRGRPPGSKNKVEEPAGESVPITVHTPPQQELASYLGGFEITIADFSAWAETAGHIEKPVTEWEAIPTDVAARLLLARKPMANAIVAMKGGAQ